MESGNSWDSSGMTCCGLDNQPEFGWHNFPTIPQQKMGDNEGDMIKLEGPFSHTTASLTLTSATFCAYIIASHIANCQHGAIE